MFRWLSMAFMAFETWQRTRRHLPMPGQGDTPRGTQRPRPPFPSTPRRDNLQGTARPIPLREIPAPPMRWLQTEYLLKGIYLGLVLFAALQVASIPPGEEHIGTLYDCLLRINLASFIGLFLALLLASLMRIREKYRVRGRVVAYVLFLLLESSTLAYVGILGGTVAGIYLAGELLDPQNQDGLRQLLAPILGGAAVAGLAFGLLRQVQHKMMRVLLILALAAGLVATGMSWLGLGDFKFLGNVTPPSFVNPTAFAIQLLLGIPCFYLLTFAGHEEESEVEIGAMTGLLCLGLVILVGPYPQFRSLALFLPLILYFAYTVRKSCRGCAFSNMRFAVSVMLASVGIAGPCSRSAGHSSSTPPTVSLATASGKSTARSISTRSSTTRRRLPFSISICALTEPARCS